ncbi:MAG: hypothetical protein CR988_00220 [Treponema sp.]|nr:MAG: hypothetical protein CR988_00220 [Treponema sp.]
MAGKRNSKQMITWHCGSCGKVFQAKAGKNPEAHSRPIDDNSLIGFGAKFLQSILNAKNPSCPDCGSKTVYNDWDIRRK